MASFMWLAVAIELVCTNWIIGSVEFVIAGGSPCISSFCLDGTLPGYHLHRGYGSGTNGWLIQLEGGGWCNNIRNCVYRKTTRRGSSSYMEKQLVFTGILSNKAEQNPGFYTANLNWGKLRYCDGASFTGDSEYKAAGLQFRGQQIWQAAMEELMSKGMRYAKQALLSGCSAGGLASILHCDGFGDLLPRTTKVDVSDGRTLRNFFGGVVGLQGLRRNLPRVCTSHMDPTSIQSSLAPPSADPLGYWHECRLNHQKCSASQIQFLQGFREHMLNAMKGFSRSNQSGLFINSCFAHCQSERQDTWFAPTIRKKMRSIYVIVSQDHRQYGWRYYVSFKKEIS